jgi:polysaccharide deacetylase family protein (PEP-CTERM system associated)
MNILTFDIEEWYVEKTHADRKEKYAEYDFYLDKILEILDRRQIKATFFCVGGMGLLYPEVVRKIHAQGHEIGCHSHTHAWLNKMTMEEFRSDTRQAVDSLQQCIGDKVVSYRAPAFSIGERNKWAFEVLAENGIEKDASVFPAARDIGGFPNFGYDSPVIIDCGGAKIKEFPISMTKLFGKEVAYSGGGYFRFFPLSLVKKWMKQSKYNMCYFHISDLTPETGTVLSRKTYEAYFKEPGTIKARYSRYFRTNFGKKNAFEKMTRLIDQTDFIGLQESAFQINWENTPIIKY